MAKINALIKSPYPYFGSKKKVIKDVWERFGEIENFIEPFAGSMAVMLGNPNIPKIETINDFDCVSPDTCILKDDFTWVRASELKCEDKLIAFDENCDEFSKKYRKLNHSTILSIKSIVKPCYQLTFDDGTIVTSSSDHLWLSSSYKNGNHDWCWIKTENLICNHETQKSWLFKFIDHTNQETSSEANWLSNILNEDGCLTVKPDIKLYIIQNPGAVLNRIKSVFSKLNIEYTEIDSERKCKQLVIDGNDKVLNLLLKLRPVRLINIFLKEISNISLYDSARNAISLISKEFIGEKEVVAIHTSSNTFIANGLASHNCFIPNFWRAVRADADKVAEYADYPVLEADLHARHRWLISPEADNFKKQMSLNPNFYDAKIAGWWVWGMNSSLGITFCKQRGLNCKPFLSMVGQGITTPTIDVQEWFKILQSRLKKVRVCCGDWSRVVTPSVTYKNKSLTKNGMVGVFLDPPYLVENREDKLYRIETNVFYDVCKWALENSNHPRMRIAVCGYEGDFEFPSDWTIFNWKTGGGFSSFAKNEERGKENSKKETIWFSPNCIII